MNHESVPGGEIKFLTRAAIAITVFGLLAIALGWISLTHWIVATIVLTVVVVAALRRDAARVEGADASR